MVVLFAFFILHDLYFLKLFCKLSFNLVLSDAFSSLDWFIETGVGYLRGEVTSLILTETMLSVCLLRLERWLSG